MDTTCAQIFAFPSGSIKMSFIRFGKGHSLAIKSPENVYRYARTRYTCRIRRRCEWFKNNTVSLPCSSSEIKTTNECYSKSKRKLKTIVAGLMRNIVDYTRNSRIRCAVFYRVEWKSNYGQTRRTWRNGIWFFTRLATPAEESHVDEYHSSDGRRARTIIT